MERVQSPEDPKTIPTERLTGTSIAISTHLVKKNIWMKADLSRKIKDQHQNLMKNPEVYRKISHGGEMGLGL